MRCKICHKPLKENTDGNKKYCQGHFILNIKKEVKKYQVEVSYTYEVRAKNAEEAEEKACELYGGKAPRNDEVNYQVKEVKKYENI